MGSLVQRRARLFSVPRPVLTLLATARARLRASEFGMTALAIGVGVLAGVCVAVMTSVVNAAHMRIYGIPFDVRLSAAERIAPLAALGAPMLGGLVLGAIDVWLARRKAPPAVDPVEANALRGGRMSLRESLLVATQTVISSGCGASVGLEAGYAQIGAGVASYLGARSRLRRQDRRMLVGCGAGGAIAAAFGAPLTGAFYAFELIIGAYSLANAIPVFAATLAATLTTQAIIGAPYDITAPTVAPLTFLDYGALIGLGLGAAAVGVGAMRMAALIERAFRAVIRWRLVRPVVGGLMVGLLALYTPQVLGAGHGALGLDFYWPLTAAELATLIVLKLLACLVSLASGFRGGLFFASLFVGSLLGKLYSIGVDALAPSIGLETTACVLVGMSALSAAIVGGPLTMTFLVLESTGNLGVAGGALAASIATTLAVRATFGYSFTTWRLHLRGETIRGGQDVGWLRDLTVGRMMAPAADVSRRSVGPLLPGRLSAGQRQCRGCSRRGRAIRRADPCRRGLCARHRGWGRRRPDRRPRRSAGDRPASGRQRPESTQCLRCLPGRHARRHRAWHRASIRHPRRGLRRAALRSGNQLGNEGGAGRRVEARGAIHRVRRITAGDAPGV